MATVKVKFRPSSIPGVEGAVYYQISHDRVVRQVMTDYKIYACEWDRNRGCIVFPDGSNRLSTLCSIREQIRYDIGRFNRVVASLMRSNSVYSVEDVVFDYQLLLSRLSLFGFMRGLILKLKNDGKYRTSETYLATLRSFSAFRNGCDIMIDVIDQYLIDSYEAYLIKRGLVPNTTSFYMRILRAVYNRAVEQGLVEPHGNPFAHVYTGVEKTTKRAVGIDVMKKMKRLDLSVDSNSDYARDMFMLSFYLRGMSFVDIAYLKKTDLYNGVVVYRRRKTGQRLSVKWTAEVQSILDKYPKNKTEYLFPVITSSKFDSRNQYKNRLAMVNRELKKIAGLIGVPISLTTYVSRHTWASIAKSKGVSISVISEGLGHDNETTTQIYLTALETSVVDKANDMIIASL